MIIIDFIEQLRDKNIKFSYAFSSVKELSFFSSEDVNQETQFQAASISKMVFSILCCKLYETNALTDLNLQVSQLFPELEIPEKLTLIHLLSHTSGANVSGYPGYGDDN